MIDRLSHATIFVLDQDSAKAFYTDKLGFEVRADVAMGSYRWLTVGPVGQPELEIVLMPIDGAPMPDDAKAKLKSLVQSGKLGAAVFATRDCHKTYAELEARGVSFTSKPAERPYGIEAVFKERLRQLVQPDTTNCLRLAGVTSLLAAAQRAERCRGNPDGRWLAASEWRF